MMERLLRKAINDRGGCLERSLYGRTKGLARAQRPFELYARSFTPALPQSLSPKEVWCVRVCSFTFVFHTPQQLEACLDYYSRRIHPSSRIPEDQLHNYGGDSGECQRWFDRLPMYLLEEPKRRKVVSALRSAASQWAEEAGGPAYRPSRRLLGS